jgi:hypothetical protein
MPSIAVTDRAPQSKVGPSKPACCPVSHIDDKTTQKLKLDPIYCRSCYPEFEIGHLDALEARRTGIYEPHQTADYGLRLKLHQVGSKGSPACQASAPFVACPELTNQDSKAGRFEAIFASRM